MSAKLLKGLTAAHLNALNSTMGAVETQLAALKTTLKELGVSAPSKKGKGKVEDEEESEDEDESEDEEESEDEDESEDEEESEDEDESEDEEDEKPAKITKKEVIAALKAYTAKHKKKALAMAKLKKVTGADSVHDVKPAKYAALIKALKVK